MTSGQCLCGALKITISGEPVAIALCHCLDCKRISRSAFAFNWAVPQNQLSVTGTPKEYHSTANSGNHMISHFCGTCGTTLWRDGPAIQGMAYVKAGMLDGVATFGGKPVADLYQEQSPLAASYRGRPSEGDGIDDCGAVFRPL